MSFSIKRETFEELTEYALKKAKSLGATDCAVDVSESFGQSVSVRLREVETIEHTKDKSFGVAVFVGKRRGNASSSDFSKTAIDAAVEKAVDIAKYTAEDPFAGLPDEDMLAKRHRDLALYHPWDVSTGELIDMALATEASALDYSSKIRNSDGANASTEQGHFLAANSRGFKGGYPYSQYSISVSPIAQDKKSKNSEMHRDFWYSANRDPSKLKAPSQVGEIAAERAVNRIGARKLGTRKCPVVFENSLATGLIRSFVGAVSGRAQYQKSSFLLDALGQRVWAPHITIKEDPFLLGEPGSSPFDEEGVKVQPRTVVDRGRLKGYFLSTYSARKLGMKSTGNAGGSHNLLVHSKRMISGGLQALLAEMGTGLLVTEMMGQGVNGVTGDYSRGAFGYWVENGVIVHPVEEITVAGNLKDMMLNVIAMGDDVKDTGSIKCSSLLIEGLTIAGA